MASSIRQKAAVAKKKVVKPILTTALTLEWPTLSQPAQAQIEAALKDVLLPLVLAREAQFKPGVVEREGEAVTADATMKPVQPDTHQVPAEDELPPVASTSTLSDDPAGQPIPTTKLNPKWSKRAAKRAKAFARQERREAQLPQGTHEITLRSGKAVEVPNNSTPQSFKPSLLLDKGKAIETRPAICDSILLGINVVTRALEEEIEDSRRELAGLKPRKRAECQQDSLRLFIPAPNTSTRRQRREMKRQLDPSRRRKRQKVEHKQADEDLVLPTFLRGIPKEEPALLYVLQEAKEEASKSHQPNMVRAVAEVIEALKEAGVDKSEERQSGNMEVDQPLHPTSAKALASTSSSEKISSELVQTILTCPSTIISAETVSMIISLLMRYDPMWFQIRNKVNMRSQLKNSARNGKSTRAVDLGESSAPEQTPVVHLEAIDDDSDEDTQDERAMSEGKKAESGGVVLATKRARQKHIRLVFVATADINPLAIVQHILTSVAAKNSVNIAKRRGLISTQTRQDEENTEVRPETPVQTEEDIYLVPLSKGAEGRLAELLGIRRVAVLAFTDTESPGFSTLLGLVKMHLKQPLTASWLIPTIADGQSAKVPQHIPTTVKYVETEVPVDPKGMRAEKKALRTNRKKTNEPVTGAKRKAKEADQ